MPLLRLTIAQPCAQSWAAMPATATGRHCATCQQTVIDFSQKTDAEILAILAQAGSSTCGRFRAGQLHRPLQAAAPAAPSRWRAWLAAAIALWGLREATSVPTYAQGTTEQYPVGKPAASAVQRPQYEGPPPAEVVQGTVQDAATQETLPGVTVLVKGTQVGMATDENGHFSLALTPECVVAGAVTLQFNYVGYVREERVVTPGPSTQPLNIALHGDIKGMMGEVAITYLAPSFSLAPRRFYYWARFWATRPFRRS